MNRCASHRYYFSVWIVLLGLLFLLSPLTLSQAQVPVPVVTNITPTTGTPLNLGTNVNPVGSTTQITGGTRPGSGTNLFHSFDSFTLGTGDVAQFMNNMQLPTTNIIARVIGKEVSTIDGTLRTNNPLYALDPMNFGAAHLWLVNPSGLLLGPNARVEVGGSVSMSTANYLRFEGTSALFDMLSSPASLGPLSVASVTAFGFLALEPGVTRGTISVQGSMLQVPEGQALSLVGGDITVQAASLLAPGGQINLVSVASPGEVLVPGFQTGSNINGASFTTMGTVMIKEGAMLDVSGQFDEFGAPIGNGKGGTVFVRGGHLELDSSSIQAQTLGDVAGDNPGIDLNVTGDAVITNGSVINSGTSGDGRAGDITVNVRTLSLTAAAQISSLNASFGLGEGGDVQISATDSIMISGQDSVGNPSGILADTQISGGGGSISLTTKSLTMDQGGTITARTFGGGQGGEINIAVDTMSLSNGGRITSHTGSFAPGGNVNVTATDSIFLLSGVDSNGNPSGILTSSFFDGQTGNIKVETSKLTLTGGSVIQSGSIFDLQGGNISVNASNSVDISNGSSISSQAFLQNVGNISISTPTLTMDNGSIQSTTLDFGNAGNIVVKVGTVSLSGGARIDSGTSGFGGGGTVTVQGFGGPDTRADAVKISGTDSAGNPSGLFTNAGSAGDFSNPSAEGAGGDIRVFAKGLTLESGGTISAVSSSASALAQGGSITVDANQVGLSTGSTITSASTVAKGGAPGGKVEISAQTLALDSGASVSASTAGGGNAGSITLNVQTLTAQGNSQITSSSTGTVANAGDAGSVTINASGSFTSNGSKVSTSAENAKGGDILIKAQSVQLSNGALISANSNAPFSVPGEGNAGNITINSTSNVVMQNSSVTTEAANTNGGDITINAPGMVRLINSKITTSVAGIEGDTAGGNIKIDPQFVILQNNSQILAKAFGGNGGKIDIIAEVYLKDPSSQVDASSTLGISGTINIQSPVQNIGGRLTPLSQKFSSAAALLAQRCAARVADGKFSTFVVAGREGLPVEPGGFLASPSWTAELLGSSLSGRDRHSQFPAVTGLFQEYDARPIQLAKYGDACH